MIISSRILKGLVLVHRSACLRNMGMEKEINHSVSRAFTFSVLPSGAPDTLRTRIAFIGRPNVGKFPSAIDCSIQRLIVMMFRVPPVKPLFILIIRQKHPTSHGNFACLIPLV